MKRVPILALVLALVLSLTACYSGEKELYDAFNKNKDITALESETQLKLAFSWEGFSAEDEIMLQQLANILNTAELKIYQKAKGNQEKTASTGEVEVNIGLAMFSLPFKVWVDTDISEDNFKLVEVIQLPPMLRMLIPGLANKEYLVYDFDEIMEEVGEEANMAEVVKLNRELQPKLIEFIEEIQKELKPDIDMISKKGRELVDGEQLSLYEIKLNDESLKELIKYTVDYILEKENFETLIREYMNSMAEIALSQEELTEEEVEAMAEELDNALPELMPELKEEFNKFMEKYEDVQILGEDGINIVLGINKEGYLVYETGSIDLKVDLGAIAKAKGDEETEAKIINLGIEYKTKTYNINSEDIEIKMPEITEKNSIKYNDLMKSFEEQVNTVQEEQELIPVPLP